MFCGTGDVLVLCAALVGVSLWIRSLHFVPRFPPPVCILHPGIFGFLAHNFQPPMSPKPSLVLRTCLVALNLSSSSVFPEEPDGGVFVEGRLGPPGCQTCGEAGKSSRRKGGFFNAGNLAEHLVVALGSAREYVDFEDSSAVAFLCTSSLTPKRALCAGLVASGLLGRIAQTCGRLRPRQLTLPRTPTPRAFMLRHTLSM